MVSVSMSSIIMSANDEKMPPCRGNAPTKTNQQHASGSKHPQSLRTPGNPGPVPPSRLAVQASRLTAPPDCVNSSQV